MKTFTACLAMASLASGIYLRLKSSGDFNYDDLGDNWMALDFPEPVCRTGTKQSPIDLDGGETEVEMGFEGFDIQDYTEG